MITALLSLVALGQTKPIKAIPADPLLCKFNNMGNTPSYLRRLKDEVVHVAFIGETEYLKREVAARGGKLQTATRSVVTALLPASEVLKLAGEPQVYAVEQGFLPTSGVTRQTPTFSDTPLKYQKPAVPLANRSYAASSWPLKEVGLTGKGVLIGILEGRMPDFRHGDLRTDDGKTRFVRIWNQWSKGSGAPEGFGYGKAYTSEEIDKMLEADSFQDLVFGTTSDHVTSSVSAAGGNGAAAGKYCGVAPEASLICSADIGATPNMIDSVRYMFNEADRLNMPCVISISAAPNQLQGLSEDGSDPCSIAISEMVQEKAGRVIVASAGNNAGVDRHAHPVLDGSRQAEYVLGPLSGAPKYLHTLVFKPESALEMRLDMVTVGNRAASVVSGEWIPFKDLTMGRPLSLPLLQGDSGFSMMIIPKWHHKGMREVTVEITPKKLGFERRYALRISYRGKGEVDVQSHGFLDHVAGLAAEGDYIKADNLARVSCPANGESVIAVGAYIDTVKWKMADGSEFTGKARSGDIAFYTQPGGPLFETYKPLVLGPTNIGAAICLDSLTNDVKSKVLEAAHEDYGGTSASGPTVAGAVALYLQAHPGATFKQVEKALREAAVGDAATGKVPNPLCGYGKLDLRKFLSS